MTPASYDELNDLPSLVNALRVMGQFSPITDAETVICLNGATAIEGLLNERDGLRKFCDDLMAQRGDLQRTLRSLTEAANDPDRTP